ncbi:MAG: hypothetical protein AAFO93_14155 [Pseudomonadota bacterium]
MLRPLAILLLLSGFAGPAAAETDTRPIGITPIVIEITNALDAFSATVLDDGGLFVGDQELTLKSAKLNLNVAATKIEGEAGFSLQIVSTSAKASEATAQRMSVTLVVPPDGPVANASPTATEQLLELLLQSTEELTEALAGQDVLIVDDISVATKFSVARKAGGGLTFSLFGLGVKGGVSREDSTGHEIILTFEAVAP